MIKSDIVENVAEKTDMTKARSTEAVNACIEAFKEAILREDRIELRGFAVFEVKKRKSGVGRNPRTGEEVEIPAGKTVRFKPGKKIRNLKKD